MLAQVGVLALFAHRVPLAANYPEPIEATADLAMIVVQLALAVLLAPDLLSDRRRLIITLLSAAPMTVLAMLLAGRSQAASILPAGVEVLWLCVFARFRKDGMRSMLVLLTIAGPILRYLVADFSPHLPPPNAVWALSPTLGVILLRLHAVSIPIAIAWPTSFLVVGMLIRRTHAKITLELDETTAKAFQ